MKPYNYQFRIDVETLKGLQDLKKLTGKSIQFMISDAVKKYCITETKNNSIRNTK